MFFWASIGMGLAGSLHCVGMCGPIAMALPYRGRSHLATLVNVLVYNIGRVLTYSMMGLILGIAGRGLVLAGLQNYFSIGIGVALFLAALLSINIDSRINRLPFLSKLRARVGESLGNLLKEGSSGRLFSIGILNGLLPCGMVYMALFGAISTGSMWQGMAFMALFGLGTIPLMAVTALGGHFISLRTRGYLRKVLPFLLVAFAVMFILRGLQVDVPGALRLAMGMQDLPMCQ